MFLLAHGNDTSQRVDCCRIGNNRKDHCKIPGLFYNLPGMCGLNILVSQLNKIRYYWGTVSNLTQKGDENDSFALVLFLCPYQRSFYMII